MTLTLLKRKLNWGAKPHRISGAESLGSGSQRTAYRIGPYVVKRRACAFQLGHKRKLLSRQAYRSLWRVPRAVLWSVGVSAPATWYAGPKREWMIQRYYKPAMVQVGSRQGSDHDYPCTAEVGEVMDALMEQEVRWWVTPAINVILDLHPWNFGVHPRSGRLVCFDW